MPKWTFIDCLELLNIKVVYDNAATNHNRALIAAARFGHLEIFLKLLEIKSVYENATAQNNQALEFAAANGNLQIVFELLKIKDVNDNAANNDNSALGLAARNGHLQIVIELLKIQAVYDKASADDNYALRLAANNGYLPVVLELLKIPAVYHTEVLMKDAFHLAAKNGHFHVFLELLKLRVPYDNPEAVYIPSFHSAVKNGHLQIVLTLLKIKVLYDHAATHHNKALFLACKNKHWLIFLELLKIEPIKKNLHVDNHRILREVLRKKELGIAFLIIKMYREQEIPIPDQLTEEFKAACKVLSDNNKCVDSMITLSEAIFKHKIDDLCRLLKNEKIRNIADMGNNLALLFAVEVGHVTCTALLLKIPSVQNKAAANNNRILMMASISGHVQIVSYLLKFKNIYDNAALNNREIEDHENEGDFDPEEEEEDVEEDEVYQSLLNLPLRMAAKFGHWAVVLELLNVQTVKGSIHCFYHEALKIAINAEKLSIILRIIEIYRETNHPLPKNLLYKFGECYQPLASLQENVHKTQIESLETMQNIDGWPSGLTMLVFQYADMPIHNNMVKSLSKKRKTEEDIDLEGPSNKRKIWIPPNRMQISETSKNRVRI